MASPDLKEEGNSFYRSGNFKAAEDCYTRALEQADDSAKEVLYLNRSAARLALRDWHGAEQDADASLKLAEAAGKPGSWKAFLRRGVGHRQRAMCAEKDLLKAMQLAPLTEKRRVAAELSLNYSMKQMGLNTVGSEYGLPDGRVQHIGHPKYSENMNMFAGMDASLFLGGLPPTLLRVKMRQHSAAGPDMNPILGPSADPDPSFWLGDDEDE